MSAKYKKEEFGSRDLFEKLSVLVKDYNLDGNFGFGSEKLQANTDQIFRVVSGEIDRIIEGHLLESSEAELIRDALSDQLEQSLDADSQEIEIISDGQESSHEA